MTGPVGKEKVRARGKPAPAAGRAVSVLDAGVPVRDVSARPEPRTLTMSHKTAQPVFVHSSYRTSSTWLWHKLRGAPNTIAYCEIFHEALSSIDVQGARLVPGTHWRTNHPSSAPYFLEYLHLLKPTGGMPGFDAAMAYDRFIPADGVGGHLSCDEERYVRLLIDHAAANQKIPVLTCTRVLGRVTALKRAFNGTHILLYRNLFHQWASYCGQVADGNTYFMDVTDRIIKASRHDPFLRSVDDWFSSRTMSTRDEQTFLAFLFLHLYTYAHAYDAADLTVDATALATDADLRHSVEQTLSALVRSDISLADARSNFELSDLHVTSPRAFLDTVDQFTKYIVGSCTTEASKTFVRKLTAETLSEWDRHEFFTRQTRAYQQRDRGEIAQARDDARAQVEALSAERDGLAGQLGDATAGRHALEGVVASLTAERDGLVTQLVEAVNGRQMLDGTVVNLTAERDGLVTRAAEITVERQASDATVAGLSAERDAMATQLVDAAAERQALNGTVASLTAERDGLAAQAATITVERQALDTKVASLTAERDRLAAQVMDPRATSRLGRWSRRLRPR